MLYFSEHGYFKEIGCIINVRGSVMNIQLGNRNKWKLVVAVL